MITMRKSITSLFILFSALTGFTQTTGIGQWRDHLPYSNCIAVKEVGSRIYCATPYSLFYYDKEDNSIQRINKINGLSDIAISTINYNATYNTLVVAYTNANIDLIKNGTIINISDIKRSPVLGNKTVNDIYFIGQFAYLSCGFGIVVLDIAKEEIHDTYYIGPNGSQINVFGLTKADNDTLFVATEHGLFLAYSKSSNLANYQSWKKDSRLNPVAKYGNIINFSGQLVVSKYQQSVAQDTLYRYSNNKWTKWAQDYNSPVGHFEVNYGKLLITCDHFVKFYDSDFNHLGEIYTYNNGTWPTPFDAVYDHNGIMWIADNNSGLLSVATDGGVTPINISGPLSSLVFAVTAYGNDVYVVPGAYDGYSPLFHQPAVYHFNGTSWMNESSANDPLLAKVFDLTTVSVDPADPKRIYSGTWNYGLAEIYDGKMVNRYGHWNSTLSNHFAGDTSLIRVGGTAFDSDGNLWVVNSATNHFISRYCRTCAAGSQWTGYSAPILNDDLGPLMIDHSSQKWVIMRVQTSVPGSLLVFKEDPKNPSNSKSIMMNQQPGSGNIPGQAVFAMAVDKNGQVWIGTEKGIGVFFNPENIFSGQNFDAQQILVQQGAYVQYLMENEKVTAIAVDGANRKWIGTEGGGLYLFSEDGTKQIFHFTTENSPLLTNNIIALAINPETGEVFIGTDQGLVSYKGTATEGGENFSCTYAFPNPVKEDYDGLIGIKCLVDGAQVRITDIEGNLIFSTKADGGQAVWDGKNFNGRKAKSGVYLVYAGSSTGSQKIVTKILILH